MSLCADGQIGIQAHIIADIMPKAILKILKIVENRNAGVSHKIKKKLKSGFFRRFLTISTLISPRYEGMRQ